MASPVFRWVEFQFEFKDAFDLAAVIYVVKYSGIIPYEKRQVPFGTQEMLARSDSKLQLKGDGAGYAKFPSISRI